MRRHLRNCHPVQATTPIPKKSHDGNATCCATVMSKRPKRRSVERKAPAQPVDVLSSWSAVPSDRSSPRGWIVAAALAISLGTIYGPALNAPLIFDDVDAITNNDSITAIWPIFGTPAHRGPLNPLPNVPTAARPLVNLSFAINYKFSQLDPVGYHAVNAIIHFLSAMLLWAIVRRTLCLPYFAGRFDAAAGWLAFAVAVIWALHPLQTETVIYATQRTELMMALFYLATIYFSLRYWASSNSSTYRAGLANACRRRLPGRHDFQRSHGLRPAHRASI